MSNLPAPVLFLQDNGLILSRSAHMAHHKKPFESNYCIVSGHCNGPLDRLGFFRRMEAVVERLTGNKPRCQTEEVFDDIVEKSKI